MRKIWTNISGAESWYELGAEQCKVQSFFMGENVMATAETYFDINCA